MQFSVGEGAAAPLVWVVALGLSLVCLAAAGFDIFFSHESRSRWIRTGVRFGLLFLALLAIADLNEWILRISPEWQLMLRVAVLSLGMLGLVLVIQATKSASRQVTYSLACLSLLAVSWTSVQVVEMAFPSSELDAPQVALSPAERVEPVPTAYAKTDSGRPIPLFQCRELDGTGNPNGQPQTVLSPELMARLITVAPPNEKTNCHGWVFAGGQFVIQGRMVDFILSDNGYENVGQPLEGDVILYRDSNGVPAHTGIVKATGNDGFVLIESKWGFDGQYLHQPQDQGYSKTFEYFRSPRPGHTLQIDAAGELAQKSSKRGAIVLSSAVSGS